MQTQTDESNLAAKGADEAVGVERLVHRVYALARHGLVAHAAHVDRVVVKVLAAVRIAVALKEASA